jgi:hypothetical protein
MLDDANATKTPRNTRCAASAVTSNQRNAHEQLSTSEPTTEPGQILLHGWRAHPVETALVLPGQSLLHG